MGGGVSYLAVGDAKNTEKTQGPIESTVRAAPTQLSCIKGLIHSEWMNGWVNKWVGLDLMHFILCYLNNIASWHYVSSRSSSTWVCATLRSPLRAGNYQRFLIRGHMWPKLFPMITPVSSKRNRLEESETKTDLFGSYWAHPSSRSAGPPFQEFEN